MNKIIIFLFFILMACNNKVRTEKVCSEIESQNRILETYIYYNYPSYKQKKKRDSLMLFFTRKRVKEILEKDTLLVSLVVQDTSKIVNIDSSINEIGLVFYEYSYCTKRYFRNYHHLKGSASKDEYCEDYDYGFYYKYEKNNSNLWTLKYPIGLKDTLNLK